MNILSIVWDPSIGLELGPITIRYYSLMYIFGFAAGYYILKKIFDNEGLDQTYLDPILTYAVIGTLLGARLGHVFFYDWNSYYKNHLEEILLPIRKTAEGYKFTGFQGLASHGATIGIFLAVLFFWYKYLRGKHSFLWILDRITLTVPVGAALIRIGNLLNSEIVGKPTGTDYGFIFKQLGETFPRYPTQLYEAGAYFSLLFIMLYLYWKTGLKKFEGMLFGIFFILLWFIRLFIEFYKEPQDSVDAKLLADTGLNTGQWLSIPFILVGIGFVLYSIKTYRFKS
jgi:prolipoprotein diacylglyceryl transferase